MKILRARLARRTSRDGLMSADAGVPLGKIYEVDIHRVFKGMELVDPKTGRHHRKDMIMAHESGDTWRWIPLELIDIEIPQGFEKVN